ncbi:hypothetical protein V5799_025248, partial [Amblyomma americanum]
DRSVTAVSNVMLPRRMRSKLDTNVVLYPRKPAEFATCQDHQKCNCLTIFDNHTSIKRH